MSELSEFLRKHQGDRSVRSIGREAASRHDVGESTVIPYFSGTHGRPQDKVLVALADVLKVSIRELRRLAGMWQGESWPYSPPTEANLMDERQRRAVDELIRAFVRVPATTGKVVQGRWGDRTVPPPSRDDVGVAADSDE